MPTPITALAFEALPLGYLTGTDIMQFCSFQLLQVQYAKNNASIQNACTLAYSEVIGALSNRYNIAQELAKTGPARSTLLVKIATLLAIRNILGSMTNISPDTRDQIKDARQDLLDIRNGQLNIPLQQPPTQTDEDGDTYYTRSSTRLIPSSFGSLG